MPRNRRVLAIVAASVAAALIVLGLAFWRITHHLPKWLAGDTIVVQIDAGHPYDEAVAPKDALKRTIAILRERARAISSLAFVQVEGPRVRVLLPRIGLRVSRESAARLLTRSGRLEFKLVDERSVYMRGVAESLAATPIEGVEIAYDEWRTPDGAPHRDLYVRAATFEKLRDAWATLVERRGLPADHIIVPEQREGEWRSYYVYRHADLTGDAIAAADNAWDQGTGRPEVSLVFDSDGAKTFENVTAGAVGHKLAIILEDVVQSAPVIEGKIAGGRARITLGGFGDVTALQAEAKDLVAVLRTGGLPAPVHLVEEKRAP